jgi:cholesterol transport system auxiliary component
MTTLTRNLLAVAAILLLASGCSLLTGPAPVAIDQYVLEYEAFGIAPQPGAPVLVVTTPRAHGGYDTSRMAYMQQAYGLRYFTMSRWADTPARMLAPLLAEAVQETGRFQAVYAVPGSIVADLRLDTELVQLHQDFTRQPSVVHLALRAQLVDVRKGRVLVTRHFDVAVEAESDDAYGGVVAANRALELLLSELAQFCAAGYN